MRRAMKMTLVPLAALALVATGCGDDEGEETSDTTAVETTETTEAAEATVTITDAWARATAPGAANGGVFMLITAEGADDALIGGSVDTSIAGSVEVHETVPADEATEDEGMDGMGDTTTTAGMDGMGDTTTTVGMDGMGDMGDTSTTMEGMPSGMEGMMMRPIDRLELPADEEVALEPGGYHVMLIDLVEPLVAGETFELSLQFENAGEQTITVEVREV